MHIGEVVWYVTGRFYATETSLFDVGYFLYLSGIDGPLFNGAPGEGTAHFTFSADPFTATDVKNGDLDIALDATGTFGIYFNENPSASFDDPASFARGQRIATFERVSMVAGVSFKTGPASVSMNVFTARLVSSEPFRYGDLREIIPYGVTQWGTAAAVAAEKAVPFIGSAIRVS